MLIISACYSGSFIEKLKNEKHVIATAAAEDKTSNGCSPLHHQTYYGQALVEAFNSYSDDTEKDILNVLKSAVGIINKKENGKKTNQSHNFSWGISLIFQCNTRKKSYSLWATDWSKK